MAFKSGSLKKESQKRAEIDQGHNVLDETDLKSLNNKERVFFFFNYLDHLASCEP